jgi:hypothetical protein
MEKEIRITKRENDGQQKPGNVVGRGATDREESGEKKGEGTVQGTPTERSLLFYALPLTLFSSHLRQRNTSLRFFLTAIVT